MSRGRSARAPLPAGQVSLLRRSPVVGGCTFAEDPGRRAPEARIIWHADLDPGAIAASAVVASSSDPDAVDAANLSRWLSGAVDAAGVEHVVLSDGWQHIRLDIERGSLLAGDPVVLHYRLAGLVDAEPKLLPLRRLIQLVRHRRFVRTLTAPDPRMARHLLALRVHDALADGASQREIAEILFGSAGRAGDRADSLRSRVRRLVREARRMAGGGWRTLMRRGR